MTEARELHPGDGDAGALVDAPQALRAVPPVDGHDAWTAVRLAGHTSVTEGQTHEPGGRSGGPSRRARRRVRRLPGLDGLRGVAVLAVVVFHLDVTLLPGGFLGVDVFFVISGFLITNLIATELLGTGGFRIGRFYARRARRLLPTVLVLLAAVTVAANTVWRDQLATLRGGVLASLGYFTNWWLIADHQSYFVQTGRPTMLQHLWSLAIEEQYYVVWSLAVAVIAGALVVIRRPAEPERRMPVVIGTALALALASTAAMAAWAVTQDVPYRTDTSRVYFGSDTHTMGLFLGSAAGAWLALRVNRRGGTRPSGSWAWLTDVVGAAAVIALIVQFRRLDEFDVGLYRGGFLAIDALVLLVICCAARRAGRVGRVLDIRPLRWVGQRSYSIYVWHWPVAVVTRPGIDVDGPAWLINAARLVLVLALSALSYRFVEVPVRTGAPGVWWRGRRGERQRDRPGGRRRAPTAWAAAVLVLGCAAGLAAAARPVVASTPAIAAPPLYDVGAAITHRHRVVDHQDPCPPVSSHPARATGLSVSAFGDSVLLGAQSALTRHTRRLQFDAIEGRQAWDVLADVRRCAKAGGLQPRVLIHIGDNGVVSPDQLAKTLAELHSRRRVVLMTVRVPRDWQDPNNATLRAAAAKYRNVTLVDWRALSRGHSRWLYGDDIHLRPAGAAAYERIALQALRTGRSP